MIDAHTHLDDRQFSNDLPQVVERAQAAGVALMVTTGDDLRTSRISVDLADRYDCVYAVVGVHPHHAAKMHSGYLDELRAMAAHPKVVAMGEMGLDYFKNRSPKEDQQRVFREQLELAAELRMPVVIHNRDAGYDTYRSLAEWAKSVPSDGDRPLGVLHCFSEDIAAAERYIKLGFLISLAGPVSYPSARNLWGVAERAPLDKTAGGDGCTLPPAPEPAGPSQRACVRDGDGGSGGRAAPPRRACSGRGYQCERCGALRAAGGKRRATRALIYCETGGTLGRQSRAGV